MKSEHLIDLINKDYDVHAATAALLNREPVDDFVERLHSGDSDAKAQRQRAKTINFALLYGVGVGHLSELLHTSYEEAARIKTEYFAAIPEANTFIHKVQNLIVQRGWIRNFYGRRRRLTGNECYKGPNALIQGCAADIVKHRLVVLYDYIQEHNLDTKLINIVHDEVQLQVPEYELEHVPKFLDCLQEDELFRTFIKADVEMSNTSWADKKEVEIVDGRLVLDN